MPETVFVLKKMGSLLDALSTPAGQCTCCPDEPGYGEWYYEPATPGVIKQKQPGDVINIHQLEDGDILKNEASGLSYRYDETAGMVPTTFIWPNRTYIILGEISGAITVPEDCTLIFQGGKFTGSLTGNYTTIEAGPVQIFDVGLELSGTFTNEYAYPEWWGALATRSTQGSQPNCRASIQAALDSVFGEIRFCPGLYYIANAQPKDHQELSLLYLNITKTLKLSGRGHNASNIAFDGVSTVIWTRDNVNVLLVNILSDKNDIEFTKYKAKGHTLISGGEFNVSECSNYSHTAILVYPTSLTRLNIKTSLVGSIGYVDKNASGIIWPPNTVCPDLNMLESGYKGFGIRFSHNPALLDGSGNLISGAQKGICYLSQVDSNIYGFGHGFVIDYSTKAADMTSMELRGYIDNCFRYIFVPTHGFNGGVVESVIQTRKQNSMGGVTEPIIQGDFTEAYLDPMIWDLSTDVDVLRLSPNSKKVRLGQRLLGGMMTRFRSYGFGEDITSATREAGIRSLATIASEDSGSSLGAFGIFDLLDLSTVRGLVQSTNYVHLIDNDLLSIDSAVSGFNITVQQQGLITKYSDYGGIHKPGTSPFDRSGMVFAIDNPEDSPSATLRVTINFPSSCQYPLQFMAMHLKGSVYHFFSTMKVELTGSDNTIVTLFNGSYADIQRDDNRSDIILPFIFKDNHNPSPKVLDILFTGFNSRSGVWTPLGGHEDFKFSIEGRYCRHFWHNVFSAGGGTMGRPLTKFGKLFLSGTETYANISALPADAANGALATIGNGSVLTNYPVMKTYKGWMIQGLVGTSLMLSELNSSLGDLAIGQQAFDTTLGAPVWWNGKDWVDATGVVRHE